MSYREASAGTRTPLTGFAFDRDARPAGSHWWWISATLAALLLRLIGLGDQSLWTDEVESLKLIVKPGEDILYVLSRNFHGPLHKALLVAWTTLLGVSDVSARALSAVLGTATVTLTYFVGRRWLGPRTAGVAAWLLAVNPFHIYYSQEVRGYVLLMGLGLLGIGAFLRDVRLRSAGSAAVLFLTSLAACLSSFGGLFLIAAEGVLALAAAWRRGYPIRRFLLVHVLVLICLVPYVMSFGATVDPESIVGLGEEEDRQLLRGAHTFSPLAPAHTFYAYSVGITLGPSLNEMHRSLAFETFRPHLPVLAATALLFGTLALLGVLRAARRPELRGMLLAWLIVPIAATVLLAILNVKVYNVRYPSVGFLPWIYLLALGVERIPRAPMRAVALAGVVLLSALSLHGLRSDPRYARSDARSAAELILREGRPGDRILNYTVVEPFEYYYRWRGGGELDIHHLLAWHFRRGRLPGYLDEVTSCEGRLWVVRQRSWYIDPRETCKAALDEHLEHLGSWRFTDLPVDLYACADSVFGEGERAGR